MLDLYEDNRLILFTTWGSSLLIYMCVTGQSRLMLTIRAYSSRNHNMRKEREREVTSSGGVYRFIWARGNRGF